MPEQPDFDITTLIPGEADSRVNGVPIWCDLILEVTEDGSDPIRLNITRNAGEVIIDALHDVLHPWSGRPIIDYIWDELDRVFAELKDATEAASKDTLEKRGYAQGLATALALMYNPYEPNIDGIREIAVERWEQAP